MTVVSGLHEFLADDPEFAQAAAGTARGWSISAATTSTTLPTAAASAPGCLRIHTIGNDCSCGKMVAAVEVARGLASAPASMRPSWPRARPASSWPAAAVRSIASSPISSPARPRNSSWPISITR